RARNDRQLRYPGRRDWGTGHDPCLQYPRRSLPDRGPARKGCGDPRHGPARRLGGELHPDRRGVWPPDRPRAGRPAHIVRPARSPPVFALPQERRQDRCEPAPRASDLVYTQNLTAPSEEDIIAALKKYELCLLDADKIAADAGSPL